MKRKHQFLLLIIGISSMLAFPEKAFSQVLFNYDPDIKLSKERTVFTPNDAAFVWVDTRKFTTAEWRIRIPGGAALFMGEALWMLAEEDTLLFISNQELESRIGKSGELKISAFKRGIATRDFSVRKGFFDSDAGSPGLQNDAIDTKRSRDKFKDFFFIIVLAILFFLALFRVLFPSIFGLFWNPIAIFSFEDLWESVSFSKIYSAELLFYLILINMGMALMIIFGIHLFEIDLFGLSFGNEVQMMVFIWLACTLCLTLITFLKFIWLGINTYLFELDKIALPHFFYLLKVSGFGLLVMIGGTVILYTNNLFSGGTYVWGLFISFLVVYTLGIIGLSIWLYKKNGFNNYHLFSYLCTSELIPFLVICKLLLG